VPVEDRAWPEKGPAAPRGQRPPAPGKFKQSVNILHYRFKSKNQSMLVEFLDGATQTIPVSWTDRGTPGAHDVGILRNIRLSPFALLELTERIKK
jgi:hypothetical protein